MSLKKDTNVFVKLLVAYTNTHYLIVHHKGAFRTKHGAKYECDEMSMQTVMMIAVCLSIAAVSGSCESLT